MASSSLSLSASWHISLCIFGISYTSPTLQGLYNLMLGTWSCSKQPNRHSSRPDRKRRDLIKLPERRCNHQNCNSRVKRTTEKISHLVLLSSAVPNTAFESDAYRRASILFVTYTNRSFHALRLYNLALLHGNCNRSGTIFICPLWPAVVAYPAKQAGQE